VDSEPSGVLGIDPAAVERSPLGLGVIAADRTFAYLNPALASVLGRPREQLLHADAVHVLHEEDRPAAGATLGDLLSGARPHSRSERRYVRGDGTVVWRRVVAAALPAPSGAAVDGVVVMLEDVTQEKEAAAANGDLSYLVSVLDQAVYTTDAENRITRWNAAAERLFGWTAAEAIGQTVSMLASPDRRTEQRAWLSQLAHGHTVRGETVRLHKDGVPVEVAVTATPVLNPAGRLMHVIGVYSDISERNLAAQRLQHMARHDRLTGLMNRHGFSERLHEALTRSSRTGQKVGLLFIDLDRFKDVNDSHGHQLGDQYLRIVGARLHAALRSCDTLARWGGDEFAVLVEHVEHRDSLTAVAERLLASLTDPVHIGEAILPVAASVGVATATDTSTDQDLLRSADLAMYEAKRRGGRRSVAAWELTD
jgi:diguanylate cyclase (GGDEF)-like protein/PAS domain S-box-containing protein